MIDFTSGGIFAAILGQNPLAIREHISKITDISSYFPHYPHPVALRYIDMLKEFTGFESVALFSTGSEAVEAFMRCMRFHSGKGAVWGGLVDPDDVGKDDAKPDAMHGMTLGSLIAAGKISDTQSLRFGVVPDATSSMIMEPYHAPSAQFHRDEPTIARIKMLQKEFKSIPLCVDEVQGGFGRAGRLFAHQWYDDLKPDFVTIGKACGGGLPLSALLGPKDIMESEVVREHAHLHSTHSGNPWMCAAGIAVIEEIQKHDLIDRSQRLGIMLKNLLADCGVRHHAGRGLLAGLEFENQLDAGRVVQLCLKNGLKVVNTGRKWIKLGPAFTIQESVLEQGCIILKNAIKETLSE
jgi:4-aminobutyrate aminotransferase-like enzyme